MSLDHFRFGLGFCVSEFRNRFLRGVVDVGKDW